MLVLAQKEQLPFFYEMYMHPKINPFLLYERMPIEDFQPIFFELVQQQVLYQFLDESKKSAGMIKIVPQKYRNSHIAYIGGIGILPEYWGRGYGGVMLGEAIALCQERNIKRLELTVASHNHAAIKTYQALGFKEEGLLKNFIYLKKEAVYIDEVMMALVF